MGSVVEMIISSTYARAINEQKRPLLCRLTRTRVIGILMRMSGLPIYTEVYAARERRQCII